MGMGKEIKTRGGAVELCREHDQVRTRAVSAAADVVGRTGCIRTSKGTRGEDSWFVARTVDFRGGSFSQSLRVSLDRGEGRVRFSRSPFKTQ